MNEKRKVLPVKNIREIIIGKFAEAAGLDIMDMDSAVKSVEFGNEVIQLLVDHGYISEFEDK